MEGVIDGHANALLALAHAEGAAQLNLVSKVVFGDQILELLDNLAGALDEAGRPESFNVLLKEMQSLGLDIRTIEKPGNNQ